MLTFYVVFFSGFSYVTLVASFFKHQIVFGLDLSYDFFVCYYFFLRLYNSLQKNKLSSFKLG